MRQTGNYVIPIERVESAIVEVRGKRVVLGPVLARLYGVSPRRLNEQVRRNLARFPDDFMFQLTWDEVTALKSQLVPTSTGIPSRSQNATLIEPATARSRSQTVIPKRGRNIKYLPYAFTEHGAVMAATILNSARAVEISVFVVRAFVRMRQALTTHRELAVKLARIAHALGARVSLHLHSSDVYADWTETPVRDTPRSHAGRRDEYDIHAQRDLPIVADKPARRSIRGRQRAK